MNAFMSYKFSTKNLILNGNCNHDDDNKQKKFFF